MVCRTFAGTHCKLVLSACDLISLLFQFRHRPFRDPFTAYEGATNMVQNSTVGQKRIFFLAMDLHCFKLVSIISAGLT